MATATDEETLKCLLKRAFYDDRALFDRFCTLTRESVPDAHAAVLRGSAITGVRYDDGAPFDGNGPGTSDLDLTLVGAEVLKHYSAFWIPGFHSKPLSDTDPDIAPDLVPLRRQLMDMVHRLPPHIRAFAWITGKTIRWVTIRMMLEAGYADSFRVLHPSGEGNTFSTHDPQVRLDYAFVPEPFKQQLTRCEVVRDVVSARNASDHFPLLTELRI